MMRIYLSFRHENDAVAEADRGSGKRSGVSDRAVPAHPGPLPAEGPAGTKGEATVVGSATGGQRHRLALRLSGASQ
jgi:hypothetical protein